MTVYVDAPVFKKPNGRVSYAHMTADGIEELHQFAKKIGVGRHWFHRKSKYPHYDINSDFHVVALQHGAELISSQELSVIAKRLSQEPIPGRGHI